MAVRQRYNGAFRTHHQEMGFFPRIHQRRESHGEIRFRAKQSSLFQEDRGGACAPVEVEGFVLLLGGVNTFFNRSLKLREDEGV